MYLLKTKPPPPAVKPTLLKGQLCIPSWEPPISEFCNKWAVVTQTTAFSQTFCKLPSYGTSTNFYERLAFKVLSPISSFWLYCSYASLKEWFIHPQTISRVTYSTWKQNLQDAKTKTTSLVCQSQMIHLGIRNLAETGCNSLRVVTNLVKNSPS